MKNGDFMEQKTLKDLLTEYNTKRQHAIEEAENKKVIFMQSHSDFAKIEDEISRASIFYTKSLLTASPNDKQNILVQFQKKINTLNEEKNAILKKEGINPNYFEPDFDCKICKDTGYIRKDNTSIICSCLKQEMLNIEYNKSNMGNLDKENFSTFSLEKYSNEVNEQKYNSNISPRENIKNIKLICENFIKNFDNPEEKNLLFTGNTGLGKTFLSNCIAFELLKKGKTVLYQTAPVMLDSVIDYRFDKPNANQSIVDNLMNVDLLIIDDLGTETINSMKFTELYNIINARLLNQSRKITKTIISTNLSIQNIFKNYEERLGSRFVGHYNICRFFGDDIRFMR